ncbi:hypothetical protein [Micromonospora schwarzwaldensis]|uniref:hypothetical protein n=1 Tax=Micromonospora sp. DSM 45708 TaxID=3111767 RepID=UPI0031E3241F
MRYGTPYDEIGGMDILALSPGELCLDAGLPNAAPGSGRHWPSKGGKTVRVGPGTGKPAQR